MRMTDDDLENAIKNSPEMILSMERDVGTYDTEMENILASSIVGFSKKILEMAIEIKELRGAQK